jgi:acyl carrier protein
MSHTQTEALTGTLEAIVRRFAPKNHVETQFTPETHLVDDVGIDSPRMIDIVLEIEDRFGFTIEDEDAQRVRTFGELMQLVQSHG